MKKILLISYDFPLPEDHGSRMRTMNFVRFFQNYGTIDLVYKQGKSRDHTLENPFNREYLMEGDGKINRVKGIRRFGKRIHRLINRLPWIISEAELSLEKGLSSLIYSKEYDIILSRYAYNAASLLNLAKDYRKRVIIDYDDILSDSLYDVTSGENKGIYWKLRTYLDKRFLMNYEKRCLCFGTAIFCSEKDRKKMAGGKQRENTFVVPNIYRNEFFMNYNFGEGFNKIKNILFVGTLNYRPNVAGLEWFIESILPDVRRKYNDVKIYIVGKSPKEDILNLCRRYEGIKVYPDVEDVRVYYKECGVIIVPLMSGGGTRIKILEAGLSKRPVISTPVGAYGLDLVAGKDLLLFEDKDTFLSRYTELQNQNLYNTLVYNLCEVVLSKYSTAKFNEAMENVLMSLFKSHKF